MNGIDASGGTRHGRLANDEWKNPNAVVKRHVIKNVPRLGIFANCSIISGEEIRYDYGQVDAPWRRQAKERLSHINRDQSGLESQLEDNKEEFNNSMKKIKASVNQKQDEYDVNVNVHEPNMLEAAEKPKGGYYCGDSDSDYNPFEDRNLFGNLMEERAKSPVLDHFDLPDELSDDSIGDETDRLPSPVEFSDESSNGDETYRLPSPVIEYLEDNYSSSDESVNSDEDHPRIPLDKLRTKHKVQDEAEDTAADQEDDTAADRGFDTAADQELDTAADQGEDTAADQGEDTAADQGEDTAADQGEDTAADQGEDTAAVRVLMAKNCTSRKWDKSQVCVYCLEPKSKLARHFQSMHASELEVQKAFSYNKNSPKRKSLLKILTNKGNHAHNVNVLQAGHGLLIPYKRPTDYVAFTEYIPCEWCFGYFVGSSMWKHMKKCPAKQPTSGGRNNGIQARCSLLLPLARDVDDSFRENVLSIMMRDNISILCKNDPLILSLGQKQYLKSGKEAHSRQHISQRMREMGRLLKAVEDDDPDITSVAQFLQPALFDKVIKAVHVCAKYDKLTQRYKIPSLALKLGHSLKKVAGMQKVTALKTGDDILNEQSGRFIELCNLEWADDVSSNAIATLSERKWNDSTILPLAADIVELHKCLSSNIKEGKNMLMKKPDKLAWHTVASSTLAKLILFNRRRSGEVQRMKLDDYTKYTAKHANPDVLNGLSEWEQKLCLSLRRVEIRGKRGRKVPILLTSEMKKAIDVLLATRSVVGVSEENPYLFARPNLGAVTPLRGHDCLAKLVKDCKLTAPEALTSTKLRKHIATVSQLFCLRDNELDILANFLGHDIRVHREYYRLPEDTLQMSKVAKLLLVMEKGNANQFKGKRLDEIELPLDEPCTSEEELSEDEEERNSTESSADKVTCDTSKSQQKETKKSKKSDLSNSQYQKKRKMKNKRLAIKKTYWSSEETAGVENYFQKYVRLGRVPRKHECETCKRELASLLSSRTWMNIKYKVYNLIQTNKRRK